VTDKEDAFGREVVALEKYDGRPWIPRWGKAATDLTYTELAAYFHEIARRAMTCAFRAEEAARELRTARPDLEPD